MPAHRSLTRSSVPPRKATDHTPGNAPAFTVALGSSIALPACARSALVGSWLSTRRLFNEES
eukprot:10745349-Karenia_brevis.AAC.1